MNSELKQTLTSLIEHVCGEQEFSLSGFNDTLERGAIEYDWQRRLATLLERVSDFVQKDGNGSVSLHTLTIGELFRFSDVNEFRDRPDGEHLVTDCSQSRGGSTEVHLATGEHRTYTWEDENYLVVVTGKGKLQILKE